MVRPVFGLKWLVAPLACLALSMVLGVFNDTTEIIPIHDTVLNTCFALGGLGALVLASVAVLAPQPMSWWKRLYFALAMALLGFLSGFLLSNEIAGLTENYLDFPAKTTRTFHALIRISRAYQTHGKGQGWTIQTTPIWSNLSISESDYQFMLSHRRPGDPGKSPDEVSSRGYFCAKVVMQQSGDAFRVLHAGNSKLPEGSIITCPAAPPH